MEDIGEQSLFMSSSNNNGAEDVILIPVLTQLPTMKCSSVHDSLTSSSSGAKASLYSQNKFLLKLVLIKLVLDEIPALKLQIFGVGFCSYFHIALSTFCYKC